jgi:hypothetical protein
MYSVLVVHPNKDAAEVVASWLQRCNMQALPLTDAVDAIEHVENLRFDLAVVSKNLPPELPQLLLDSHRAPWLEILELRDGWVYPEEFVLAVSKFAQESRCMCFWIANAWHTAWYGEAGFDASTATEEESHAKLCRSLINTIHNVGSDQAMPS